VLRRKSPQRLTFTSIDRLVFAGLYRLAPGVLDALKIVGPETVIRWHRAGFRAYWRWKSRPRSGRPKTPLEIRQLIREISPPTHYGTHHGFMASFSSSASSVQALWEIIEMRKRSSNRPRRRRNPTPTRALKMKRKRLGQLRPQQTAAKTVLAGSVA
jgi:hypothetical protein